MKNHLPRIVKSVLITIIFTSFLFSCAEEKALVTKTTYIENTGVFKSVTKEEYLGASILERRFIDQIDGAVNALDILKKNNPLQEYEAILTLDKDPNNPMTNTMLIGIVEQKNDTKMTDTEPEPLPNEECQICGVNSAYNCIKEAEKRMNSKGEDTISAIIRKSSDRCFTIIYQ
jgi:hypothetical protein